MEMGPQLRVLYGKLKEQGIELWNPGYEASSLSTTLLQFFCNTKLVIIYCSTKV